ETHQWPVERDDGFHPAGSTHPTFLRSADAGYLSSRVHTAPSSTLTGNLATGSYAGAHRARPSRTSNLAPCRVHSIVASPPSKSPSTLNTMIGVSPSQATAVSPGSSSEVAQTRIQSVMRVALGDRLHCRSGGSRETGGLLQSCMDICGGPGFRRAYRVFSRISKRRSPRLGMPKRSSPCGNGL